MLKNIDFSQYKICDSHHHIYNPSEFPYPDSSTVQAPATAEDYRLLRDRLHIQRSVIVQPSCYGTDNSCTLNALEKLGMDNTRAIVVINDDISKSELLHMDSLGVRGVRFNVAPGAEHHEESIRKQSKLIADLGWSIHFWMSADYIYSIRDLISSLPCEIVFDHRGHLPAESGMNHPAFRFICEMLSKEKAYVKVSAPYIDSSCVDYSDTLAIGAQFISMFPDRTLWGTDWPHPMCSVLGLPIPDDTALLDTISRQFDNYADLQKVLVDNPAKLFGF